MTKPIYQDFDFNNNKITGIADATTADGVINKGQLDSQDTALRAYIDGEILGLGNFVSEIDTTSGLPTSGSGAGGAIDKNDWYHIISEGTILGEDVHKGERLQALVDNPDTADNTAGNADWKILHSYNESDSRYDIDNLALTANTPEIVTHGLGFKFVQVALAGADGKQVDVEIDYVDSTSLVLTSSSNLTVSGAISV